MLTRLISGGIVSGGLVLASLMLAGCAGTEKAAAAPKDEPVFASANAVERVVWAEGLSCPQCSSNINMAIKKLDGVEKVAVNLETGRIGVLVDPNFGPSAERIAKAVRDAGFDVARVEG